MKIKKVVQFEVESTKGAKITDENVGDYVVLIGGIMSAKMPTEESGMCDGGIIGNAHVVDWVMDGFEKAMEDKIMTGNPDAVPQPQRLYTPSEILETIIKSESGMSENEFLRCFDVLCRAASYDVQRKVLHLIRAKPKPMPAPPANQSIRHTPF